MPTFANPAALWALLGIPAILAIHFLQRRARRIPISTLFLLERTRRDSVRGRRFERLVPSVPLWLQLLAILLLTWLLGEPRFEKPGSTQRVAVVLDPSASMSVFTEALRDELEKRLPRLQGAATALDLQLLQASTRAVKLYSGPSLEAALEALDDWTPRAGTVDPTPTLQLGRSLVGRDGALVYVTDTPTRNLPFDARLLALGEPTANVGITGVSWEQIEGAWVWRAVVRNYSATPARRDWHLQFPDGSQTAPTPFEIEADGLVSLQASLDPPATRAVLTLSGDRFALDDRLPLLPPQPKTLRVATATAPEHADIATQISRSLDALRPAADPAVADLQIASCDPLEPRWPSRDAIVFLRDQTPPSTALRGSLVATSHPLVRDLNWQSLRVRASATLPAQGNPTLPAQGNPTLPARASDEVLLWQGDRPLVFLRRLPATADAPARRQLCFDFDPLHSNLTRQPAFIVCLHRFAESLRLRKVAATRRTLETGQPIELATQPDHALEIRQWDASLQGPATRTTPSRGHWTGTAPLEPGFLEIRQQDEPLLEAAVFFADTREADLRACGAAADPLQPAAASLVRHTREDGWWRLWVLLLLLAIVGSWSFSRSATPASATPASSTPQ